ncbi:MAG: CPBP family glutamic-type intramembrane protease [Cyclobacteriaceae bacterium]|nr:CPBP family glutamic-type intramembrane protease [Cyclobacteriaceae bacterium]
MIEEENPILCTYCGAIQPKDYKFCSTCGRQNNTHTEKKNSKNEEFQKTLTSLAIYTFTVLFFLVISAFTDDSLSDLIFWTVLLALIDLGFAFYHKDVWKLMSIKAKHTVIIPIALVVGLTTGIIVHYSTEGINTLFNEFYFNPFWSIYESEYPLFYGILFIAVFPALFEELAFRGFVYNNIKTLSNKKSALFGSAFIFALVHFSLSSIYWLFPFGLLLAWIREKYNTLIPGMLIHFAHNSTVVIIDIYFSPSEELFDLYREIVNVF